MTVAPHAGSDRRELEELARRERDARQRDRYRAVALAMDGLEGDEVAEQVGRSPRFVDEWVGRYRRGGIGALVPRKQPGRRPKLTAEQEERLKAILDAGPPESSGLSAYRGRDVCEVVVREFGVVHTLGGIYDVLRRLGYSSLVPRPRHPGNDPAAMERFARRDAPLLSGA
ncbi:MAG TPA: winged helix-turn-helix domain-containing protein [Gemmatimonadales bacterium]|nr:winged helix-turn-helix domain-containing protein [Gemmatimonadales bacterium]